MIPDAGRGFPLIEHVAPQKDLEEGQHEEKPTKGEKKSPKGHREELGPKGGGVGLCGAKRLLSRGGMVNIRED